MDTSLRGQRIRQALWCLFIGDALAMPGHWYYDLEALRRDFDGGLRGYRDAPHPHPDSFMVGMPYHPDVETARRLRRPYDILHEHARFYATSYRQDPPAAGTGLSVHGNPVPRTEDRYHYHHGLKAGDNTLGAHLVRVLMRSVNRRGRYDPDGFLDDFIDWMTTAGCNRDPYTEIYLRQWFENYSRGLPPRNCAAFQRDTWSIGAHGGAVRPLVLSLLARSSYSAAGMAQEHLALTHRSESVASALQVMVPLLQDLLADAEPGTVVEFHTPQLRLPQIDGATLKRLYRDHKGPGNIPREEMWRLHTRLEETPFDLSELIGRLSPEEVIDGRLSIACYPEHGVPLLFYLAARERLEPEASLLANANAGGDSVHRGMLLGLLVGAAAPNLPEHLVAGLSDRQALQEEIGAFSEIAVRGEAF